MEFFLELFIFLNNCCLYDWVKKFNFFQHNSGENCCISLNKTQIILSGIYFIWNEKKLNMNNKFTHPALIIYMYLQTDDCTCEQEMNIFRDEKEQNKNNPD